MGVKRIQGGTQRRTVAIGTRASKLALAQAEIVHRSLLELGLDLDIRIEHITTRGDVIQDRPLSEIGGNGLFVTQIEEALRVGRIDLGVHSAKDLPSALASDMTLAAFPPRADACDVLVSTGNLRLADLPSGARIGTGSPRRACYLNALRPDITVLDIRGNVDTRLRKLREGQYDAIVLAAAGLERLDLAACISERFDPTVFIPAVAQGALAVEVRAEDQVLVEIVAKLNDAATASAVRAERAFLATVGGTCSLPVGAYATIEVGTIQIFGMIGVPGGRIVRGEFSAPASEPERAGSALAMELLANGGRELIEAGEAVSL